MSEWRGEIVGHCWLSYGGKAGSAYLIVTDDGEKLWRWEDDLKLESKDSEKKTYSVEAGT